MRRCGKSILLEIYQDYLKQHGVDEEQIIVTGVRRCGKSMLLEIYRNYLKEHGIEEEQIISINFEDLDYEELTEYK